MEWLEDFLSLAETQNFSRSAQARAIAQPAFSRHIRSLEEWVGVNLVDRTAHPVELTAAGKTFEPLLKATLANLEAARIKARAAHDQSAASLRFAATHVLSLYFFPKWLVNLEQRLRLGPVQTMSDSSQSCEDLMLQRRVQFMLCYGHPDAPSRIDEGKFPMCHLGQDCLIPVCSPKLGGVPLHDLDAGDVFPLLGFSDQSGLGRIMRSQLQKTGPDASGEQVLQRASIVFTAHNAVLLKTMAMAGRGLAWLPQSLIQDELSAGSLIACGGASWNIPLEIRLYRQHAEMSPVAEVLWSVIQGSSGEAQPIVL